MQDSGLKTVGNILDRMSELRVMAQTSPKTLEISRITLRSSWNYKPNLIRSAGKPLTELVSLLRKPLKFRAAVRGVTWFISDSESTQSRCWEIRQLLTHLMMELQFSTTNLDEPFTLIHPVKHRTEVFR